ncbi:MAG: hypothetical protein QOD99_3082 [Chthoniobacter sp.]|jgi:hypothetical protein|nr:hypothetical protein [Chthoniobacter sp.]
MLRKPTLKAAAIAAFTLGTCVTATVFAGVETPVKESKAVVEETAKSCITGDLGVTFVTKYFSRGINNGDQGVIAQPYADLYFKIFDGGESAFINGVTINASIWSSLHSHHTGVPNDTVSGWQEFDYTPGIAVTFLKNFTLTTSYFEFDYPSGLSDPQRSINVNLAFNDSDYLGVFALHPHFAVLKELPGAAAGLGPNGWYFEPGIAPSFTLIKDGMFPTTLTLPITAGFGGGDFYLDQGFGFFSAGGNVAVGLGFMPKCLGTWTATVGATYYYLDKNLAAVNVGRHNDWVGSAAIGVAF